MPDDLSKLSYEEAVAELERIVTELERGDVPLETTLERFERGVALARRCEDRLHEAEARVTMLVGEPGRILRIDHGTGEVVEDEGDATT